MVQNHTVTPALPGYPPVTFDMRTTFTPYGDFVHTTARDTSGIPCGHTAGTNYVDYCVTCMLHREIQQMLDTVITDAALQEALEAADMTCGCNV